MTLYSWFLRNETKKNTAEEAIENELSTTLKPNNYLNNFTIWPTAKIKPNADVKPLTRRISSRSIESGQSNDIQGTASTNVILNNTN